jgi:hypothetical protein
MIDPSIIGAAARALEESDTEWGMTNARIVQVVLAAVTPLIRDQVLEEAAKVLLELAREERNLDGATLSRAAEFIVARRNNLTKHAKA